MSQRDREVERLHQNLKDYHRQLEEMIEQREYEIMKQAEVSSRILEHTT